MITRIIGGRACASCRVGCVAILLLLGQAGNATEPNNTNEIQAGKSPLPKLDLHQAITRTLSKNALLARYPLEFEVLEARRMQAGVRPVPRVELNTENVGNSDASTEITLTLSQVIEFGGKRKSRVQLVSDEAARRRARFEIDKRDVLAETTRRYYEVLWRQSHRSLSSERLQETQTALQTVRRLAAAGAVATAEVSRLEFQVAALKMSLQRQDDEQHLASNKLSAMWLKRADFVNVRGDLTVLPSFPIRDELIARLDQTPQVQLGEADQRLAEARLRLAQSQTSRDVTIGGGYRHLEGDGSALVLSVSMPLFQARNKEAKRAAATRVELASTERNQVRRQTLLALEQLLDSLAARQAEQKRITGTLLPLAETLLKDVRAGYSQGRFNTLQWLDAQNEMFELKVQLLENNLRFFNELLALEQITGQSMLTQPGAAS